ncbi:MAG: tetratricopeptide repeat protein [Bryobacteraceae bacterium]
MQTVIAEDGTKHVFALMLGVLGVAGLGIYWSLRFAIADGFEARSNLSASAHAIALVSGDEEYLRRAGELTEEAGGDGTAYYRRAAAVDPFAANDWMQLGFHAERSGRYQEAERDLLKAASVDQSFEPRWTLANFYFRRDDSSNTLRWIRKSLSIAEGDFTAVFRLCWQATGDPGQILREAMPNRPGVLGQYLNFLFSTNRFEESTAIAMRLVGIASPDQTGALLDYCDRALTAAHPDQAATVWNALSRRGLIPQSGIGGNLAHTIRNRDFHAALTGRGFDWKSSAPEGVLIDSAGSEGLRIEFSGKQGDESVILSQYVHLTPETRYVFNTRYQSEGIAPGAGLRWRLLNPFTGREVENAAVELPSANSEQAQAKFIVPPYLRWGLLRLLYNRRPGTNRIEGSLRLIFVDIAAEK